MIEKEDNKNEDKQIPISKENSEQIGKRDKINSVEK
jgi:hypothetical protein